MTFLFYFLDYLSTLPMSPTVISNNNPSNTIIPTLLTNTSNLWFTRFLAISS